MKTLYLVDGSGYIFRAYYAVQPLSTRSGLPTNALFGFVRMFQKLLRDLKADHIAVAFDTGQPTFRHKMYSEYKANRKECPADLVPQMPYFRKIVQALGIKTLEQPGVEADDVIATLADRFAGEECKVIIVSGDKDLTQLVSPTVEVWDLMRDVRFDRERVKEKFGVYPEQMVDFLTLTGDSSDNVPGVRGIGPKTAVALIEHAGSIEKLLERLEEIPKIPGLRGAQGVKDKLESARDTLRLSQRLVTLERRVEPFSSVKDVDEYLWTAPKSELLVPLFAELEFEKLAQSLRGLNGSAHAPAASAPTPVPSKKDFQVVTAENFPAFVAQLKSVPKFAIDTETTSLNPLKAELVGMSFSWKAGEGFYLPLGGEAEKERQLNPAQVHAALALTLADPKIKKVGLNLKYDMRVLETHGYELRGIEFDSMLASYVLNPDRRQHGLAALTQRLLDETMVEYEDLVGERDNIGQVPIDEVCAYACHDAEASWNLAAILEADVKKISGTGPRSLWSVFAEIEMPLLPVLARMEQIGIKLNIPFLNELSERYTAELKILEQKIYALAGHEFNLNSPKQLGAVLFEELQLPTQGVPKTTHGYSTNVGVLERFAEEYEIVRLLMEYRELHKLLSTYVDALREIADPETARVHTSFNQAITATGRLSSSDPNLQNIPIKHARGRELRQAFIADKGKVLISADYSQIELRILAHLSQDKTLLEAFRNDEDIHLTTAREIFGADALTGDEAKEARRAAKTINFGLIYGMSAFRLAGELGISRGDAQRYIDRYFERYSSVKSYFSQVKEQSVVDGYVETYFGRRRFTQDIDVAGRDSGYVERSLANAPLQGTAADIIKLAMIRLYRAFDEFRGEARMVLQVHDEVVFEVPEKDAVAAMEIIRREMEQAAMLDVPLKVDVRRGDSWGTVS